MFVLSIATFTFTFTLLYATCSIRLHTLLHVVACCWELLRKVETSQAFEPTSPYICFVL